MKSFWVHYEISYRNRITTCQLGYLGTKWFNAAHLRTAVVNSFSCDICGNQKRKFCTKCDLLYSFVVYWWCYGSRDCSYVVRRADSSENCMFPHCVCVCVWSVSLCVWMTHCCCCCEPVAVLCCVVTVSCFVPLITTLVSFSSVRMHASCLWGCHLRSYFFMLLIC